MFDRRLIINFDWATLLTALFISVIGVVNIYSSTYPHSGAGTPLYLKQAYWLTLGLGAILLILALDYRTLVRYSYLFYLITLLLLILVMAVGRSSSGSQRWLQVGFISFQPSELSKIALILAMTRFFTDRELPRGYGLRDLAAPFLMVALPALLIFKQPDLGTVVLLLTIFTSILVFVRVRFRTWAILGTGVATAIPLAWHFLKDYQKNRLLTFINPDLDPLKTGYHIAQSKIAVGSGTLSGKGFLKGTQSQLRFLPEQHTDFIFTVIGEEGGFVASALTVALFAGLLLRGYLTAARAGDDLSRLVAAGIVGMWSFHVIVNIGMTLGVMPVAGVPLPFVSYGGSSLLLNLVALGLLLSIGMRRHKLVF